MTPLSLGVRPTVGLNPRMSSPTLFLQITLKDGPVLIPSLRQAGVSGHSPLWQGIVASEFFPPGTDSAFYVLTLGKPVSHPDHVSGAEADLIDALRTLAAAWPFAGGSFMVIDTQEVIVSRSFETNADAVRDELLAKLGRKTVSASVTIACESLATYARPPLVLASAIAKVMQDNPALRRLLHYHQRAWVSYYCSSRGDRASWFIDLYKVRDLLKKLYQCEGKAISRLNFPVDDWKYFGGVLNNNDLRHAEITDTVPDMSRDEVDRLFVIARNMVTAQLKISGLSIA